MLSAERKAQIEAKTNEVIERYNLQEPNFDLAHFLSTQEGFLLGEQDMDNNTTGILLVNKAEKLPRFGTNQLISTNARLRYSPDYKARRRFIVAHEYAHYQLHMEGETIFAHRDYTHKNDPMEEEADFFARCLLMPRQLVEVLLRTLPQSTSLDEKAKRIASTFGVTEKKATQRLTEDLKEVA